MAVFLVDFDGTCVAKVPGMGYSEFDTGAERVLKELISNGHKIVLWTCRNNSSNNPYNINRKTTSLEEAIEWFRKRKIRLHGINIAPGQSKIVGTSRKALGDFIIDDTSIGIPIKNIQIDWIEYENGKIHKNADSYCVDWEKIETILKERNLI